MSYIFALPDDEFVLAKPEPGESRALYIFGPDGFHSGRQYFAAKIKYPDEEISIQAAMHRALEAVVQGNEVRVTNGGDELLFRVAPQSKGDAECSAAYPPGETVKSFFESLT